MLARLARRNGVPGAGAADGADALDHHQAADRAEEQDVAQRHEQIELTDLAQDTHQPHADGCADHTSGDQHQAHLDVDVAAPVLGDGTADGGGEDLHRAGADGDGGGHAHEDQAAG